MSEARYLYRAENGKTYEASIADVLRWYGENRLGPDDFLTHQESGMEVRVRDLINIGAAAEQEPNPPEKPFLELQNPPAHIGTNLTRSFFAGLCGGCAPLGVIAIAYSIQAEGFIKQKDYGNAQDSADKAYTWGTWSFVIAIVQVLIAWMVQSNR